MKLFFPSRLNNDEKARWGWFFTFTIFLLSFVVRRKKINSTAFCSLSCLLISFSLSNKHHQWNINIHCCHHHYHFIPFYFHFSLLLLHTKISLLTNAAGVLLFLPLLLRKQWEKLLFEEGGRKKNCAFIFWLYEKKIRVVAWQV